ncbi:hypothetical protein OUZ56_025318 [Daphnia magna]|uniref:Uncharacterized protein n=1 Tax=Daphnia magna TaxID=35525 RepID=A0ABQ9ZJH2_9CRUS|nr:hypothetical protein OUZ56_025318 [Daphnia magna]
MPLVSTRFLLTTDGLRSLFDCATMRPKVDRSGICGQDHQHEKAVCSSPCTRRTWGEVVDEL